jgi:hypothetical protein
MTWPPDQDSPLLLAHLFSWAASCMAVKVRTPPSRCWLSCVVISSTFSWSMVQITRLPCRGIFGGRLGGAAVYYQVADIFCVETVLALMLIVVEFTAYVKQTSLALINSWTRWLVQLSERNYKHVRPVAHTALVSCNDLYWAYNDFEILNLNLAKPIART